ncbi:MAG TPA: A24 family peptidase, partial [Thermomicrobiales bacterium]|nr:A24 family peptidase [Thermomicrobiales bacterium]
ALVPLLGPLWAGRCAGCGVAMPWLRPATELVTGALFALASLRYGLHPGTAVTIVFIAVLLVVLRIDWRHHLIFPQVIYTGLLLAFADAVLLPERPHDLLWAVVAAVAAAALFLFLYALALVLYRRRALGSGDVLLAAMIGAMAGPGTVAALTLGMLLGAVGGLTLVALRVRTMRDFIPYGAYLCAGTIIALLVF